MPATREAEAGEALELLRQREILPLHSSPSDRETLSQKKKKKKKLTHSVGCVVVSYYTLYINLHFPNE